MTTPTVPLNRRIFPVGINHYVPGMKYDASLVHGGVAGFSLGSPAASDDDAIATAIDGDATAGTIESYSWTSDAYYGRNLILTTSGDPGATGMAIDVRGYDWLGQPMVERFTTANGSTAIQYGKKAFYRVTSTKIVTAATNARTAKLGTGTRLGLPYKSDVAWAKENSVLVPVYKRDLTVWRDIAGAGVAGGPSGAWVYADFPGFVKAIRQVQNMPAGSTNDPVVTVELGGTAIVGLTVTGDTSAAATGALTSDTPTTAGYSANNRFAVGDLIEIVLADADSAGATSVGLVLTPTQFSAADMTDPGTTTTGDPRGTYDPLTAPAGVEILVGLMAEPEINTSGNGGLHGIQHYYA
jgi:hypothetical protein